LAIWEIAPALVTGNCIVLKPGERRTRAMTASRIAMALFVACFLVYEVRARAQSTQSPGAEPTWDEAVAEAREASKLTPQVDRGREIYQVCSECHLPTGVGQPDGTMPQLAGQHISVLIKQMTDIRSGLRDNPSMYPYVARLDGPQDLVDVAAYIETLPVPEDNGLGLGTDLERGKQLYADQCSRCHGVDGEGLADAFYPRLARQHYRYLVRQMIDSAGGRRGNASSDMNRAHEGLSARELASVADYASRMAP
jgi:cytochrome c553